MIPEISNISELIQFANAATELHFIMKYIRINYKKLLKHKNDNW